MEKPEYSAQNKLTCKKIRGGPFQIPNNMKERWYRRRVFTISASNLVQIKFQVSVKLFTVRKKRRSFEQSAINVPQKIFFFPILRTDFL